MTAIIALFAIVLSTFVAPSAVMAEDTASAKTLPKKKDEVPASKAASGTVLYYYCPELGAQHFDSMVAVMLAAQKAQLLRYNIRTVKFVSASR